MATHPFGVFFTVADRHPSFIQKIRQLSTEIPEIMMAVADLLGDGYKSLDRSQGAIVSTDGKKQLRYYREQPDSSLTQGFSYSIRFHQSHLTVTEFFSIEELLEISRLLKRKIERVLETKIDDVQLILDVKFDEAEVDQ